MTDLVDFAKRVQQRIDSVKARPRWELEEAERYMAGVCERRQVFEQVAVRLNDAVIQPRLETFANYLSASVVKDQPAGHCTCWFGYCERFPASTKVAFAVEHDVRIEKVAVCYEVSMTPVFIKLNQHDRLTLELDHVDDIRVADWVEERLLEFLDSYLRIDRGGKDCEDEATTDPVCGMRISRSSATASDTFRGHAYYFCSTDCKAKFAQEPAAYVQVITM